ncbi:hypothetical protein K469DRAFT_811734 [Zopfia rhizophila CBS 207.26]|uniref:MFS general substrate transporter n=1 Tax=Zopfia rhizophila CBS 207.26 TaxID=1314779 RepID=A0A6A6EG57_9PEZI|nr:hypothetical protein K469DRAFT_811734 [Zopfia rhizophila CBS 207.26]
MEMSKESEHHDTFVNDPDGMTLTGETSRSVKRIEAISRHITFADRILLFVGVFIVAYAESLLLLLSQLLQRLPMFLGEWSCYLFLSSSMSLAGAVLYQTGFTLIAFLVEIIVADVTSLRSRLFFSYIAPSPYLINGWVSGDRVGDISAYKTPYQIFCVKRLTISLFWQLDVPGIFFIIAILALLLIPFTLAVIAPLVIGFCLLPAFVIWKMRAPHPLAPIQLLKGRAVWRSLGIAFTLNAAWAVQDYLYTVLIVAFNESILSATRITNLFSFTSVLTGMCLGLVVYKVRQLKWLIVFGTCLNMVAWGFLIHYRGGDSGADHFGIVGAQALLGFAGGFFPYTAMTSIQAATWHEHLTIVTGLCLSLYSVGGAVGNAISGAIWTQILPGRLEDKLAATGNKTLADICTLERDGIVAAYGETQRILTITGICIASVLIFFAAV